ncbi:hypothetical protein FGG78_27035 [Thioclava sp. BHET1]|nr:hypothetical protein FGG78_27035 [Thioclava sp. BHET1]
MTTFKAALAICGLSEEDAAQYLDQPLDRVQAWHSGAATPPRDIWGRLAVLYGRIEDAATSASDELEAEMIESGRLNARLRNRAIEALPGGAQTVASALALLITIQTGLL